MVLRYEEFESAEEPYEFLFAHFERSADPLLRNALISTYIDELGRRFPDISGSMEIKLLERDRLDQVRTTSENACRLWATDCLPATECHQVRTLFNEPREVLDGGKFCRSVNDDGEVVFVGYVAHVRKWRRDVLFEDMGDRGGVFTDRVLVLPEFDATRPGSEVAVVSSDVDDRCPTSSNRVVVSSSMGPRHNDLVGETVSAGKSCHRSRIGVHDAGGRTEQ